ncbi:MAG: sulfotransferase family 2 domain-containing protein [Cyanobacteria bacterium J06638_20]
MVKPPGNLPKDPTSPVLCFVHIPKTAGTTLNAILLREYSARDIFVLTKHRPNHLPESFKQLGRRKRNRYRVMKGHFPYGFHEVLKRPYLYMTLFRHPVDRVISHYHYVQRSEEHYIHQKVGNELPGLREYIEDKGMSEARNGQAYMMVGPKVMKQGENVAELAKEILREKFTIVGTAERFDESLLVMKAVLGWKMPFYISLNVTRNKPRRSQIDPDTLALIEKHNQIDFELYELADQMLDELLKKHVPFAKVQLFFFRLGNRLYSQFFTLSRTFPESIRKKVDQTFFSARV